jgi:hypothetical protein
MGPALGVPLMSLGGSNQASSSVFGSSPFADFGSTMRGIIDPFNLFGAARDLSHDLIRAPVDIAHEAGTAFAGVAGSLEKTVTGVAGSLENTASSLLSSPLVLVGGATLLVILLSNR